MSQLISAKEDAARLGCTEAAIRKWISQGRLPRVKLGRLTRLRLTDLERLMTEGLKPSRAGLN